MVESVRGQSSEGLGKRVELVKRKGVKKAMGGWRS